jgi:biopolymer transport protein TolQ
MLNNLWGMNPVIIFVLGTLVVFSLVSWSIMILKLVQIRRWNRFTKRFLDFFESAPDALNQQGGWEAFEASPLVPVFLEGRRAVSVSGSVESVDRALKKVSTLEIEKLAKEVGFLATTASTTPFIGLFGTVWGIMNAFQGIGEAGSTSLAVVAPGISEALVTTAIGLAAAIPALVGYNFIQSKLQVLVTQIDNFAGDFLTLVEKVRSR